MEKTMVSLTIKEDNGKYGVSLEINDALDEKTALDLLEGVIKDLRKQKHVIEQ